MIKGDTRSLDYSSLEVGIIGFLTNIAGVCIECPFWKNRLPLLERFPLFSA